MARLEFVRLEFGRARNCSHEVVSEGGRWRHHVTRSRLLGVPHWPTGHVITAECRRDCPCSSPEGDGSRGRSKLVLLGGRDDRQQGAPFGPSAT